MKHSERLLTITEVAERLNVPIGTMRWRRHLGLPPHPIKVGRNLRHPEAEVDACIEALFEIERKRRKDNLAGAHPRRMTRSDNTAVVVDAGVFGARLTPAGHELAFQYRPLLAGRPAVLSYSTFAELRFGATLAGWGAADSEPR